MFDEKFVKMYEDMNVDDFVSAGRRIYESYEHQKNIFMTPLAIIILFIAVLAIVQGEESVFTFVLMVVCAVAYALMVFNKRFAAGIIIVCFIIHFIYIPGDVLLWLLYTIGIVCSIISTYYILKLRSLSVYLDTARKVSAQKELDQLR